MSDINFCNTKEQLNHLGEVVTGKVDGSPSGADIDTSTLPYTGQVRKTLPALEGEYEQSITDKETEADAAIDAYRLLSKGPYAAGITLNSKFEYITYNGESYFATNPPYTTTATLPDADSNLFAGGYTTIETVASKIGNKNELSNSNFLIPSPDAITHPNATPESYAAGAQIFSNVYAGSSGCTVTFIDSRVNCTAGDYQFKLANTGGLERVPVFTSSVSGYDGIPKETGVSHALVSDEYVVTVTPAAGDVFSVKLEQGGIATRHEAQSDKGQTYTYPTVLTAISEKPPAGATVIWEGYYERSDGGSNWGVVKKGAHTEDGGSIFSIDASTYIEANLKGNAVNAAKFGLREGVSFAASNHEQALKLFSYAKSNNTSELKFSAFYFISDGISVTQQGLRLTFSSKWNESGLQMTSAAGAFAAMLTLDAQNIIIKGGFFATESNQTSIFIRDGGKSHLEDFTVKFSEYGVLWEKGNAIIVKGMYAEVCVNGFVAQPRGEGDCNGGSIQGRSFGCSGAGLELRPNIAPTGAGVPPLHNTIDFSCEAGGVGFKSYEARNTVGTIYCEGNTTNYDVDGTANLWTLKNADNQPDIIKDFASGFDFRGGTSYFNPCYIERRIQNRDFTTSGSLIGNGIDVYIVTNNSGSSRAMTLGFLSYVPAGHKCEIYMNASSNLLSILAPAGITLIGDSSDLYGGPTVNDVVKLTVTKTSPTEAILWRA